MRVLSWVSKTRLDGSWSSVCLRLAGVSLVVDDVYRSGGTMRGVAATVRASGAAAVFGIVGARTMRLH